MKRISETYEMKVFTDAGDYFGDIEEALLTATKIQSWKIKASKNSILSKIIGKEAKGVIIPHQAVKSVGDIVIISGSAVKPYQSEAEESEEA